MAKENSQAEICADQLKALSEPVRLRIIAHLRHGSAAVTEIAEALALEVVTVSHHLKLLKHARLVEAERDGRFIRYQLPDEILQKAGNSREFLNLGCCRLELPKDPESLTEG